MSDRASRPYKPLSDESNGASLKSEFKEALLKGALAYLRSRSESFSPDSTFQKEWDRFYEMYSLELRRMARICHVPGRDVEDLVQDVWTQVIALLPRLAWDETEDGLRAWLYTLVRSRAVDLFRRNARQASKTLSHVSGEPIDPEADPAHAAERDSELDTLRSSLEELRKNVSDVNFQLVRLRWLEERPPSEVMTRLGLTSKQFWDRRHRMLCKLRDLLDHHEQGRPDRRSSRALHTS